MFIILLSYKQPIEVIDEHLIAHRAYLDLGYQKNYLIASGPQNPRTGGVMLSQLTERDTLEAFLAGDPFSIHAIANYEIIEFEPVKYHPEFAAFIGR